MLKLRFVHCLFVFAAAHAASAQPVYIGLDTNPPPSAGPSEAAKREWFDKGLHAGMSTVSLSPVWKDVEKTAGKYDFNDLDFNAKLAREHNLPVYLNIRVIDTNNGAVPTAYAAWAFDDPRLVAKLADLIHALAPRVRGQIRWVSIGNEVDPYFESHRDQIAAYRRMLDAILPTVRSAFPGALFTVNFTFHGLKEMNQSLRPISEIAEFTSLTYYPSNPDFTFRDPAQIPGDFAKMYEAAHGKKVFFQELGYASSEVVNSSGDKQGRFMKNVLDTLAQHRGQTIAAHFVWMSDIPLSLVNTFGDYYKLPNSDKFKAFLASLGYFDREGKPKPAWTVFEKQASTLSHPGAAGTK